MVVSRCSSSGKRVVVVVVMISSDGDEIECGWSRSISSVRHSLIDIDRGHLVYCTFLLTFQHLTLAVFLYLNIPSL